MQVLMRCHTSTSRWQALELMQVPCSTVKMTSHSNSTPGGLWRIVSACSYPHHADYNKVLVTTTVYTAP